MDFDLTDEQKLIRETARSFTDNEIVDRARENDRNEHFDLELVAQLAEQGYLGAIVPRDYGGAGLDYLTYGLIVEEVGRGDSVQAMIADMILQTDAARMLVWRAGYLKDSGQPNTTETSIAKLYATEAAVECANTAIQVHGGSGYVDDHPVERYFRDVRVTTLYEGTSQIQKLIIGRAATGINALVPQP